MKKAFSIMMILIVMLFSLHFTISTHYCEGKVSAVKAGIEGTTAPTCGMENDLSKEFGLMATSCCSNSSKTFSVDDYTGSSSLQIQKANIILLQAVLAPVLHILSPIHSFSFANEGSGHTLLSLPGRLAFICVFRN
jgi:hypothetical protein